MPGSPNPTPRARGGQPGNTNAVTHGFYSRAKLSADRLRLLAEAREHGSIADDIALMRTEIARLIRDSGGDYDRRQLAALAKAVAQGEALALKLSTGDDNQQAILDAVDDVLLDVTAQLDEEIIGA